MEKLCATGWPRRGSALLGLFALSLAGCATVTERTAVDESEFFARPLSRESERRAEALAHYGAGVLYYSHDERDKGLAEFEQAIELDPSNDEIAVNVADGYIRQQKLDKAIGVLERSASHSPRSLPILFMMAHAYQLADQPSKVEAVYLRIIKISPDDITPYRNLVTLYVSQDRRREAMKLLEGAFKQKSDDERFWTVLGDLFAGLGLDAPKVKDAETEDSSKAAATRKSRPAPRAKVNPYVGFARALDCFEKAAQISPEDEAILKKLADLYLLNKLYDKAIPVYLRILEKRPNRLDVRELLARSYLAQDDLMQAIVHVEEIAKREPLKFQFQLMLGELYLEASRGEAGEKANQSGSSEKQRLAEKALAKFQDAVVLNPNELDPQLRIAEIYWTQKKPDDALATLEKAKEKFATDPKLFYFYGLIQSDLKQYDKARQAFADVLTLAQDKDESILDSRYYFLYGAACERVGDLDAAAEQFRKSIELDPENHEAYNYLGYMWADKGLRLSEALDYIKRALKLEPDNGAYVDSLGWVYYKLGRYQDALQELLRAASLLTEPDPTVFDHIAECYMRLGKQAEAIQQWQKAIEVDPDNQEIAQKLKQVQAPK